MRRLAVLPVLAVALGLAAQPAGAARAAAADFEQAIPSAGLRGGGARAPRRFDLVGLTWSARQRRVGARIRVRGRDGRWSPWTAMGDRDDGGPGSEPVWAGGADAYELRFAHRPRGLRAHFVSVARSRARPRLAARQAAPGAATGAPAIIPRAAWGAGACPPRSPPSYGDVQLGFVHHTVSANDYTPADSAAMVLAICRFHRNVNGWRDVGYNFLVDRYGQIFEGRAGGIDQPVVGAQAQGYNAVSTGVANIGTFTAEPPTPEEVHATAQLLAWKLSLHGVPVAGRVTVTSNGGPSNRFPYGTPVTFERISGHRDADATECPGDQLYAQLGQIRAEAAALAPSFGGPAGVLTLHTTRSVLRYPLAAQLGGRLTTIAGAPAGGAVVSIQLLGRAGYYPYRRAATGADGSWSAALPRAYSRTLRASARLPDGSVVRSPSVALSIVPRIRLRSRSLVRVRRAFTVRGSLRPKRGSVTLELQRRSRGAQRPAGRVRAKLRAGDYAVVLRLRRRGLYRVRAVFAGDALNAPARTPWRSVRARRG